MGELPEAGNGILSERQEPELRAQFEPLVPRALVRVANRSKRFGPASAGLGPGDGKLLDRARERGGLIVSRVFKASAHRSAVLARESEQRALACEAIARRSERLATQNEAIAREATQRADREAEAAIRRAEEVLRLSALQDLEDLTVDFSWPATRQGMAGESCADSQFEVSIPTQLVERSRWTIDHTGEHGVTRHARPRGDEGRLSAQEVIE